MKPQVRAAFLEVRSDYPADRVVADPKLNELFLAACRERGLSQPAALLNQCLLNLRKSSAFAGLKKSKRTSFPNEEEYRFASEIAARCLEQQHAVSVDDIICDPSLARKLDRLAAELAPGFSSLQYRWAALNLRKASALKPEVLSRLAPADAVSLGAVAKIRVSDIPARQGLYVFYDSKARQALHVGEAENLQRRLGKHLDHSDNKHLAQWLWRNGSASLFLELHVLPCSTTKGARRARESELIASRRPIFNIQRP